MTSEEGRAVQAGPGAVTLQGTLLEKVTIAPVVPDVGWLRAGSLPCRAAGTATAFLISHFHF